jgi:hypothetical protein
MPQNNGKLLPKHHFSPDQKNLKLIFGIEELSKGGGGLR